MQTVKNKTTVFILVFKEFLQINSTTDFSTLCKRVSLFSLEKFLSHSAEKFRRGTLLCFRKFLLSKSFIDKGGVGGSVTFLHRKLLSLSTEELRRGTLLGFTKFLVSKKFIDNSGWGGEGVSRFSVKSLFITVPKIFVGEPCSVSLICGIEKFHAYEGNITIFWGNFVVSQYGKTSWCNPSMFYKVSGIEKNNG